MHAATEDFNVICDIIFQSAICPPGLVIAAAFTYNKWKENDRATGGNAVNLRETIESYVPQCEQEIQDQRMMLRYIDLFPGDILTRENEIAHFSASAWVVNPARDRVLMLYHNIYKSWAWPGGHADGEENLLGVALREVQEETGIERLRPVTEQLYSLEILTVNAHVKRGKYVVPHLHLNLTYLLEADDSQNIRSKPDENSAVRWFGLDEAVEASTEPEMQVVYRKLNEKLAALKGDCRR